MWHCISLNKKNNYYPIIIYTDRNQYKKIIFSIVPSNTSIKIGIVVSNFFEMYVTFIKIFATVVNQNYIGLLTIYK